jgi:hypothetical protein
MNGMSRRVDIRLNQGIYRIRKMRRNQLSLDIFL